MNVDDGSEDIRWIRGLGGDRLPAVSYALLRNLKKGLLFAIGEGSSDFVVWLLHACGDTCRPWQVYGITRSLAFGRGVGVVLSEMRACVFIRGLEHVVFGTTAATFKSCLCVLWMGVLHTYLVFFYMPPQAFMIFYKKLKNVSCEYNRLNG